MALVPNITSSDNNSTTKRCAQCGRVMPIKAFAHTFNEFYPDHHLPVCNTCISTNINEHDNNWEYIDKVCRWADIPFIAREWDRIKGITLDTETWGTYAKVFADQEYESLGWNDYYRQYKRLQEVGLIAEELPELREQRYTELRRKWGENYDETELNHLEDFYKGLMSTQNISGALQIDQAQKLCKLSLEIDNRIRAGDKEVDKFMSSYDKIIKSAEFTPKNVKNAADFDSFAEVAYWLEKHGRINKFYDGTTRDIIDEAIKNIQSYNQRLYVNEGGIGDEITERLRALKATSALEQDNVYNIQPDFNADEYDNAAFVLDEEEFDPMDVKNP